MGVEERLTDAVRYVLNGLIKKPVTWILLSIFCLEEPLLSGAGDLLIQTVYPRAALAQETDIPLNLHQFGIMLPCLMILASLILVMLKDGYVVQIYQGISPAPQIQEPVKLFIDGLKLWVINLLYMLIPLLVFAGLAGVAIFSLITGGDTLTSANILKNLGLILAGVCIAGLLMIFFSLLSIIGSIRFARSGKFLAAFEISEIFSRIRGIGWIRYIISLVLLLIVVIIVAVIMMLITGAVALAGHLGAGIPGMLPLSWIIRVIIEVFFSSAILVGASRFLSLLYDAGGSPERVDESN